MKLNSRICALALTLGMAAVPVLPLMGQPLPSMQDRDQNRNDQDRNRNDRNDQNRDRDDDRQWANNKYYRMGQKDANDDQRHHRQRKHNHKFKNDDDRRAYEAGYGRYGHGPQ